MARDQIIQRGGLPGRRQMTETINSSFHESGVTRNVFEGARSALECRGMQLHYDGDGHWRVEGGRGSPYTFGAEGGHEEGIFAMNVLRIFANESGAG